MVVTVPQEPQDPTGAGQGECDEESVAEESPSRKVSAPERAPQSRRNFKQDPPFISLSNSKREGEKEAREMDRKMETEREEQRGREREIEREEGLRVRGEGGFVPGREEEGTRTCHVD